MQSWLVRATWNPVKELKVEMGRRVTREGPILRVFVESGEGIESKPYCCFGDI